MTEFLIHAIAKLEQELLSATAKKGQLVAQFRELAAVHHFPLITPPYAHHGQTLYARIMRVGWAVAGVVGVTCFGILSTISLNSSFPPLVFFVFAAGVGTLLLMLFEAAAIAIFRVSPDNPESRKSTYMLLMPSAVVAVASFAGFSYLRFTQGDSPLVWLVSLIFVPFEFSMYGIAAAFRAQEVLYSWSAKIAGEYERTCADCKRLENLLKSYKDQSKPPEAPGPTIASSQGEGNETDTYSHSDPVNGNARNTPNGATSRKSVDGKTAA